jgi:peptidoglycan-associated lipoprotein
MIRVNSLWLLAVILFLGILVTACATKESLITETAVEPTQALSLAEVDESKPLKSPRESLPTSSVPLEEELIDGKSIDDLNREALLKAAFFQYDSAELNVLAQDVISENFQVLLNNPTWLVTIEGHCDERGTAEYNLALSEKRATAAKDYLLGLGVESSRIRVVSYGKEFPFDPGQGEKAWAKNRRAHFVITSK